MVLQEVQEHLKHFGFYRYALFPLPLPFLQRGEGPASMGILGHTEILATQYMPTRRKKVLTFRPLPEAWEQRDRESLRIGAAAVRSVDLSRP